MKLLRITPGKAWEVTAPLDSRAQGESCELLDFFAEHHDNYGKSVSGLLRLFEHIAEHGPRNLPDVICHELDKRAKIWQLTKGDLRVLWFYGNGRVVICAAQALKKGQKTKKALISQAIRVKQAYETSKNFSIVDEYDDGN